MGRLVAPAFAANLERTRRNAAAFECLAACAAGAPSSTYGTQPHASSRFLARYFKTALFPRNVNLLPVQQQHFGVSQHAHRMVARA